MTESPTEPPDLTAPNWAINHADGDLRESTSAALASEEARSSIAGQPLLFVTGQFAGQVSRLLVSHSAESPLLTCTRRADNPHGASRNSKG